MSLRQKALSAGRWTASSAAFTAFSRLAQTVVLARLLLPSDFGLMAIASAILGVLALIAEMGISRAIVRADDLSKEELSSLYWLNLMLSFGLWLVLAIGATALGRAYASEALVPLLQIGGLVLPLTALGQQFCSIAQRDLRFAELAVNEIASAALGLAAAIATALAGGGVYALLAGVLVRAAASSTLAWLRLSSGYRPLLRISLTAGRQHLRYGGFLAAEGLVSNLARQSDVFVGGLFLNAGSIGLYSVPRDLNMRIAMMINPIITRIGFPLMSRMKADKARLRVLYLQALRMTASVNFPIYLAIAILAPDIVRLLYGPRWADATPYLRILAAWGLIRSLGNPVGSLLYATGRAEFAFWWNVGLLAISAVAFWIGSLLYGVMGLTLAALSIQILLFWPIWKFMVHPGCDASFRDYTANVAPPLLVGVIASAIAWLSILALDPGLERLVTGCAIGAITYGALSAVFNRTWADAMRELVGRPRKAGSIR